MAPRALAIFAIPGFIAIDRERHRETRNLVPTGQAIAQLMRSVLAAFIESRSRRADREIARVPRVRISDLPCLREQPCKYAETILNLDAVRRV